MSAVLSVYAAGLSVTGMEILNKAVKESFGECDIEELNRDNIRYKVRCGCKDSSVVLIILDTVSMSDCKDIAGDLFEDEIKFFNYTDDKSLVIHLNKIYGLSLDIPEDIEDDIPVSSQQKYVDNEDIYYKYKSQLLDMDGIIRTLNLRISELESIISNEGYTSDTGEVASLKETNLSLNSRISDLQKDIDDLRESLLDKDSDITSLNEKLSGMNERCENLNNANKSLTKELAEERVISSQKSGIIRDKEKALDSMADRISALEEETQNIDGLVATVESQKVTISGLQSENDKLRVDISSRDYDIDRLSKEVSKRGIISDQLDEYKRLLSESRSDLDVVKKDYELLKRKLDELNTLYCQKSSECDSLSSDLSDLEAKYKESEGFVAELNTTVISLNEKIRILEQSNNCSSTLDDVLADLNEVRKKLIETQSGIFNVISTKALPRGSVKVPIFKGIMGKFTNIKFQFSGSVESRKGTYKCLFNECLSANNDKFIIIDVTSETAIDYVFQMKNIVDGMQWFISGGGVQKYLSATCLPNVKVLMPKLGYINDSYFLTVSWEKRLNELENSGYKVILYCGDISNLVGRVLFEAFSDVGSTYVYVHGNAIGSRSIVANSGGLLGIRNSVVGYYDFDKNMVKFLEMMKKKCQCKIISYA